MPDSAQRHTPISVIFSPYVILSAVFIIVFVCLICLAVRKCYAKRRRNARQTARSNSTRPPRNGNPGTRPRSNNAGASVMEVIRVERNGIESMHYRLRELPMSYVACSERRRLSTDSHDTLPRYDGNGIVDINNSTREVEAAERSMSGAHESDFTIVEIGDTGQLSPIPVEEETGSILPKYDELYRVPLQDSHTDPEDESNSESNIRQDEIAVSVEDRMDNEVNTESTCDSMSSDGDSPSITGDRLSLCDNDGHCSIQAATNSPPSPSVTTGILSATFPNSAPNSEPC